MKKKVLIVVICILIILVILFLLGRTPAKGKISKGTATSRVAISELEYIRYDAEKISFAYENKYDLRANDEGSAWQLIGKSGVPVEMAISYKVVIVGSVDDVSGVKMRQIKSEEYKPENIEMFDTKGLLFTKENPYEMAAFFLKGDRALTVAMVINSNDIEKYKAEFQKVLDSIQLK